jgi:hypothetical protein
MACLRRNGYPSVKKDGPRQLPSHTRSRFDASGVPKPRDLSRSRFELRYPSNDLDEEDENGSGKFGAPPGSCKVLRAQTTEETLAEATLFRRPATPADATSVMLSGEAIGGASIHTGSTARRRQTDIGRS